MEPECTTVLIWETLKCYVGWLIFGALFLIACARRYLTPLRSYPGPVLASFTRLWKVIDVASAKTHLNSIELHRRYGPLVRIAPNELSVSSPFIAGEILAPGKGYTKTDFYTVFPPQSPKDIFTETNENIHAKKKRFAAVPYSLNTIISISNVLEGTINLLIKQIGAAAQKSGTIDLGEWLHFFAFDSLGEVVFSDNFGFLEAGHDIDQTLNTIKQAARYGSIVGQVPFLDRYLMGNPILRYPPFRRKDMLVAAKALQEVQLRRPFAGPKVSHLKDVLSELIAGHLKAPEVFTEDDVSAIAIGAIFAGSDSTASTMQSFFSLVLRHPRVYEKICNELAQAKQSGILTSELVTHSEAQQLQYFQATLTETMRLRPGVGVNISRAAPKEGVVIQGKRFPGGTRFAINAWAVHRDEELFGPDASDFRPERWIEGDPERIRLMRKNLYQFGGGSHICLGRNFALVEMNRVLPQLMIEFEMTLVHPDQELKSEALFFVIHSGLNVHIRKHSLRIQKASRLC